VGRDQRLHNKATSKSKCSFRSHRLFDRLFLISPVLFLFFSIERSAVSRQWSAVTCQRSAVFGRHSVVRDQRLHNKATSKSNCSFRSDRLFDRLFLIPPVHFLFFQHATLSGQPSVVSRQCSTVSCQRSPVFGRHSAVKNQRLQNKATSKSNCSFGSDCLVDRLFSIPPVHFMFFQHSTLSGQPSVVSCQLSSLSGLRSAFSGQGSAVSKLDHKHNKLLS
jgi:hypothetical protein